MNNIDEILEQMEELLDKSALMPFSQNKMIIDSERLRELIDDIRLNIPQEIKRAKLIDFDCERIIKEAEQKAEQIVQQAEERAKALVSGDTIVKEAKQRAAEIVSQAQARSKEIRSATSSYVDNMLHDAEMYFTKGLQDVKRTTQEINKVKGGKNTADGQNPQ
ncbi:MAG: vacuolar-type H+-ATPase subunit H [Oscillospiraceae bacterium]|jgi:vacuolar-type H+-ATPase subunit H|nr:vacuolar-type H+-ATPase subunit H [Oscillospiraceae bacterium]MBP1568506.1 vacuolar-type H+-ATPase subunit H [Oscillospiraceae bacterium]MBP1590749.1 vacuolar-type H+-ATPase subunit H [Oscillospiraceae bacterium]MBQ5336125.1 vacuolar-type H+-ATPase subunit H [Oscillospiraceae bacterium]MBR3026072.1 vacuolar-type H+-ATPase subunit H [Oscillospiraceae bacterium]